MVDIRMDKLELSAPIEKSGNLLRYAADGAVYGRERV